MLYCRASGGRGNVRLCLEHSLPADLNLILDSKGRYSVSENLLDSLASTTYIPNADDVARRLLEWDDSTDAFSNGLLGPTSRRALEAFRDGKDTAEIAGSALSNGAAMRIGPVGAMLDPSDRDGIANFVYELSKATHMSDVAIAGASMIAGAVASAIVHADFDEVLEDALSVPMWGTGP